MAGSGRDERAWIRGAQSGSVPDLEALFRHHWPRAYRAAYLVVHDSGAAEDIAQESFLAAMRSLERFDQRRPFGPWLHRIVVNRAIDWSRSRALRPEAAAEIEQIGAPLPPGTEHAEALASALSELSPEHRAVIVMRHLLEYTPGEIAKALGLPRGTVNSRLRRGLDELAGRLEEELQ
jgi:RNA polymerase sigma-70 factor (ECF subfamily)